MVEDDHLQKGPISDRLSEAFADAEIDLIDTEERFRERLIQFRSALPDIIIMDVMLRWASPRPDVQAPQDVLEGGYYRAGFRCAELLGMDPELARVPVVMYTILEKSDLERDGLQFSPTWSYLRKSADLDMLIRRVKDLLS